MVLETFYEQISRYSSINYKGSANFEWIFLFVSTGIYAQKQFETFSKKRQKSITNILQFSNYRFRLEIKAIKLELLISSWKTYKDHQNVDATRIYNKADIE